MIINMLIGPGKELDNHTISLSQNALEANRKRISSIK